VGEEFGFGDTKKKAMSPPFIDEIDSMTMSAPVAE
jgi:hypothetical protein